MPRDNDAMAAQVVLLVQKVLMPVLERLAAHDARLDVLGDLRDRVVTVETKSAHPSYTADFAGFQARLEAVKLRLELKDAEVEPLLAVDRRLTVMESREVAPVADVAAVRDRLLVLGTKSAMPAAPVDLSDLIHRLTALEGREIPLPPVPAVSAAEVADMRDRIVTLETRASGPSLTDMAVVDMRKAVSDLQGESSAMRERVAVVEVRAQVPGPAGPAGTDGLPGRDGTLEQAQIAYDGHRTVTFTRKDGTLIEGGTLRLPIPVDDGEYRFGVSYEKGAVVTYDSSGWVAKQHDTTDQPGTSKAWRMLVKRGREGKPGRDGVDLKPTPVVKVGAR